MTTSFDLYRYNVNVTLTFKIYVPFIIKIGMYIVCPQNKLINKCMCLFCGTVMFQES